MENTKAYLMS